MSKIFAHESVDIGEDNEKVTKAKCPTCDQLLAQAHERGEPMVVTDAYTIGCTHEKDDEGHMLYVRDDEPLDLEEVTPVWF